ncbi:MAG: long-chain fatty acid--CoA ligase [Elusimicrobia bacterium]|nr:long-chain fatty acid--CoA ligase [Elusimicrobiota bacterium]
MFLDEAEFTSIALALFAFQHEKNDVYQAFCNHQQITRTAIADWRTIPALPAAAFKYLDVTCFPIEQAARVFHSSGTTVADHPSRHYVKDLTLYRNSCQPNFARYFLPDHARLPFLILTPSPGEAPHSSLVYMFGVLASRFAQSSEYFVSQGRVDVARLSDRLQEAERFGQPVAILGTSFAFVQLLDACRDRNIGVRLPQGSRVMDTGGFKGRTREIPQAVLYGWIEERLGVPPWACVNEYGMTELSSQFYDVTFRHWAKGRNGPVYRGAGLKAVPPWVRVVVVDPVTLKEVPPGQVGMLRFYDLMNKDSVMAIQTEDLGRRINDGFEVLGRAPQAELRGCSFTMRELPGATHSR